jgi:hypothetical protein
LLAVYLQTPFSVFPKPQERTYSVLFFELYYQAATRHISRLAQPARLVVQVDAVHVEAAANLFYLAFRPRQLVVECL